MQTAHGKDVFNFGAVSSVLHTPQNLMLAIDYVPDPLKNRIIRLIFLLAFVPTYIYLFRSRNRIRNIYKNINILIIDLAMLILIFALAVFLTNIVFTSKYMVVAYPLFVLLCCIFTILPGKLHNFIFGALSVYFAFILITFYRYPVNTYDFNSIAHYIEKIEEPNEPILMYRANNALPFEYSYHGVNKIIPLPNPVNFNSNYLTNIRDTLQLRSLLSNIKPQSRNFLMISDTTKFETTLDMHRKMVSDFIYRNYDVTLDTLFLGNAKGKALRIQQFHEK
jgi:hypothetical protein